MATALPLIQVQSNMDGKTIDNYVFFQTEDSQGNFYPTDLIFTLEAISGLITPPSVSVGTNPSNYNNIVSATTLTGLASPGETYTVSLNTVVGSTPPTTQVYVRVSVAAVATTYLFRAHFTGHYFV
jgi:hypothetical protein